MKKKNYRLTCLISTQTKNIKKDYENVLNLVKEHGEIIYKKTPARRSLAYSIKGQKSAFLVDIFFTSPTDAIKEMKKKLQTNRKVLRSLVVSISEAKIEVLTEGEKEEEETGEKSAEEAKEESTEKKKEEEHGQKIDEKLNQILK